MNTDMSTKNKRASAPVRLLRRLKRRLGLGADLPQGVSDPLDIALGCSPYEAEILRACLPFTMTSQERLLAVVDAVSYTVNAQIEGAFVECGVWKGGSVLAMILRLQQLGIDDRDIYLFDTFEGMTPPTAKDTSRYDGEAMVHWQESVGRGQRPWQGLFDAETFNEDLVRDALLATGYPPEHLHFVKGRVEETLPDAAPESVALLRLDTDWYESTRHELVHLWPRLRQHGVVIIDDYGHWDGCALAVDEYFSELGPKQAPLLSRIDYTGRMAVKRTL